MNKNNCQYDINSDTCSFKNRSRSVVSVLKMLPSYSYSRYSNSNTSMSRDGSKRKRMKNSYVQIFNEKKMHSVGGKKNDSFVNSTSRKGKSCYVTLDKDLSSNRYDGDTVSNDIVIKKEIGSSNNNNDVIKVNDDCNSHIVFLNENTINSKERKSDNVQDDMNVIVEEVHLREQSAETFGMNSCIGNITNNSPEDKQEHKNEHKHEYLISQPLFIDKLEGNTN